MGEKLNINLENGNQSPEHDLPQHETKHEAEKQHHEKHNKLSEKEQHEQLTALRNEVNRESRSLEETKVDHSASEKDRATQGPINKELKNMMRVRTLTRIRKELSAPDKALSKVIHSKPVEKISSVGEKTIARPIGLLGGGFIALAGTLVVFYIAKHYGFRYNLLLFIMLFVGGYMIATILEILLKIVKKTK